jgi:protein-S-isoprenylcysteine O-methyltransferase Ste14
MNWHQTDPDMIRQDPSTAPSAVPWPPLLFAVAIVAALVMGRVWPLSWPGLDDLAARVIGLGIGVAGMALAAWALVALGRAGTTVRPDRPSSALVTAGPYRRLRNPIYVADVMMLLGLAELTKNVWFALLAAVFAILVTRLAIIPEESHLEGRFGDDYVAYKERTRRWI